jgi:8-oxo-dGTP diphosphatase
VKTYLVVAGLLYHEDELLLVRQQGPPDPLPSYALPGGVVEPGELLTAALCREVKEETGLEVMEIGALVYALHGVNLAEGTQTLAYVFAVREWRGALLSAVPEGLVQSAQFWPRAQALQLLEERLPWRTMREPLLAYLRGETQAGALWLYQAGRGDEVRLVGRLESKNPKGLKDL